MSLEPYPEYKDSGVEWLGDIPKTWSLNKFRHVFAESNEVNGLSPVGEMLSISGYRGVEIKNYDDENQKRSDEQLETYRVVRVGQLAVNTMWLNYAGLGVSTLEGHVSPAYRAYWIRPGMDPRYVHHLMRSAVFVDAYTANLSGIRPNSLQMSRPNLMSFPVIVPPIAEQHAITDYLDHETAEIDVFIADQEELIALLAERRTATITQAVTKGLDPDAPMKETGVAWLGEVPMHWHISKLGHHYEVVLGKMLDGAKEAPNGAQALPYIRAGNIQDAGLDLSDVNEMAFTSYEAERLNLIAKDLLVVEGGSVGTVHYLPEAMDGWSFQKTVNRVRSIGSADTKYLGHLIRMLRDAEVFEVICNGSTIMHLTAEKLRALMIPVPPVEEQYSIAAFIDRETAEIDATLAEAREAIALSKERRAAVISAAVTGKIDVRGTNASATKNMEAESVGVA